ncbi:hypothetical protein DFP72DRAFT_414720 [Ephemerocybe angulata]|uniref:F-box/LRR-repeat protein 15-like leucin rich repeat domain-containing protein n=1 Tax=Ephemerocybe angulata TaxID=980116 RepID=A0A8H6MCG6_9AGAR|nr:hypothetical protein DFP72DRAFT_414720 [Tulosesus angulatus]
MYPENRLFGIKDGSGSSLGYNLKFLSNVIEYIPSPQDLVSLSLVCHLYLPLSQKKVWGNPKFASYHKFQQFISTLSSPQQTLPYRTFVDVINLNGLTEITDHEFKVLAGCRRVKALEIPHCLKIDSPTLLHASYQYQQLGAVDFEGLQSVTDSVIAVLARNNPNLLGAKLGKCSRLTDAALLSLAAHCSKLQEVYLQHLPLITSQGLGELITQCRALQTLDLSHCPGFDDESARLIWTSLTPLRKVLLAGCSTITDQMFLNNPNPTPLRSPGSDGSNQSSNRQGTEKPLPAAPMPLRLIRNLRHLDLTDCSLLSDFFIHLITTNSPKLHVLNLKNCCLLTDASLESMGACLGNSLHQLILAKVPEITDAGIIALTRRCRKITSLDLSECKNLTDVSVQSIATLSRIESLRLNSIEDITDTGITWLGSLRRPSLKRLHLSFCKGVTPLSIYHFLTKQPQLNFLSVSGVPSFLDDPKFLELSKASERGWKPETFRVYSGEESISALRDMLAQLFASATAAEVEGRGQIKGKSLPSRGSSSRSAYPLITLSIPSSISGIAGRDSSRGTSHRHPGCCHHKAPPANTRGSGPTHDETKADIPSALCPCLRHRGTSNSSSSILQPHRTPISPLATPCCCSSSGPTLTFIPSSQRFHFYITSFPSSGSESRSRGTDIDRGCQTKPSPNLSRTPRIQSAAPGLYLPLKTLRTGRTTRTTTSSPTTSSPSRILAPTARLWRRLRVGRVMRCCHSRPLSQ